MTIDMHHDIVQELRTTLGKLELALGSIAEAIVWTDSAGRIQWCNNPFVDLLQKPRITLLGASLAQVLPLWKDGSPVALEQHPAFIINQERACRTKGVFVLLQGDKRLNLQVESACVPIMGSTHNAMLVLRDISDDPLTAEVQLKNAALAACANAIVITHLDGQIVWVNKAFETLTGYPQEEAIGRNVNMLRSGMHDAVYYDTLWKTILAGNVWSGEIINSRKDGSLYTEEQTITPVVNHEGEITFFIAIKTDVTEKKRWDRQIQEREKKFRAIFEHSNDAIFLHDLMGRIIDANYRAEEMFGLPRDELLSMQLHQLSPPSELEKVHAAITGLELGEAVHFEVVMRKGNGELFDGDVRANLVELEHGKMVQGIVRDITERNAYEAALQEANSKLTMKQQRLEAELEAAAGIQRSLLPIALPEVQGLQATWRFLPSEYVSGDIFNAFMLNAKTLAVYMLDVAGHGTPAALVAVSVSQLLSPSSSLLFTENGSPAAPREVMERLDKAFPLERFDRHFTIAYLLLDLPTWTITYSLAAHPHPLVRTLNGRIEALEQGGPIIGMGEFVPFEEGTRTLQPGESVLLYTDGVIEFADISQESFGETRLHGALREAGGGNINAMLDGILSAIHAFAPGIPPQDDISMLVLQREI